MKYSHLKRSVFFSCSLAIACSSAASAVTATVGTGVGYETYNHADNEHSWSAVFVQPSLELFHEVLPEDGGTVLSFSGHLSTRVYESRHDQRRAGAGAALEVPLAEGFLGRLGLDIVDFRDEEEVIDSFRGVQGAVSLYWQAADRVRLGVSHFRGEDRFQDVSGEESAISGRGSGWRNTSINSVSTPGAKEVYQTTEASVLWYLNASLDVNVHLASTRVSSSFPGEGYTGSEAGMGLHWFLSEYLIVSLGAIKATRRFVDGNELEPYREDALSTTVGIGWYRGPVELRLQWFHHDLDSQPPHSSYRREVTQCVLYWSF